MRDCKEVTESEDVGNQAFNPGGDQGGLSMREVGCGLVGAGAALPTTGNRKLAVALVASGVALCWKGGTRPASKAMEQRPHKSPSKEGGKGQNKEGKGGAAHLKEEGRAGTTKEVSKEMKEEDVVGLGRSPGLRAMRLRGTGSQSSHGGPSEEQGTSKEQEVDKGPFPAGKKLFEDDSGLVKEVKKLEESFERLEVKEKEKATQGESGDKSHKRVVTDGMQRALVPTTRPYITEDGYTEPPTGSGQGSSGHSA